MADKTNKISENVSGLFYVDDQCIGCRLCTTAAPNNFKMNDNESTAYVYKQPENNEETHDCESALDECPVDAIGNDG
ncbi:ferredoxin [Methanolobus sp.]|uniref:ferredoxin n=1 Tax=Methanolobus sp. TaxID=1874737 RepID=UPI0025E32C43|nr:ferredoxin [Methanolobus sp.]